MPDLSYCAHEVYTHDRDLFLRSLFVPGPARESLLTVYALIVELEKIRGIVSEEMIGHIRLAWWQENIEALYAGKGAHGQPVLEALGPLIASGQLPADVLMKLIEAYRTHFPELPVDREELVRTVSLVMLDSTLQPAWSKADRVICGHGRRFGRRFRFWLIIKLLTVSVR